MGRETIKQLKAIADSVGYGHSMSILSALWAIKLQEQGLPKEGAFVLTCLPFINKNMQPAVEAELENSIKWVIEVSEG